MGSIGRWVLGASALGLWAAAGLALAAQAPGTVPAGVPQAIKLVKPGLFMITGAGGVAAVRITSDGLIVVDTKNRGQPVYDAMMAEIRKVSAQPVKYVVLTHYHGDHTGNVGRFIEAGAQVVAHSAMPGEMARMPAPANGAERLTPPNVTYDRSRTIQLGGKQVVAYHFSAGHTAGDTIVYFPDLKTIHMGDAFLFNPVVLDYPSGSSLVGWDRTLDQVLRLDFDTVITGHGIDPMTKDDVRAFRAKLATFRERARDSVRRGTPPAQLIASIKVDDLGWTWPANTWADPRRAEMLAAELSR